MTSQPKFIKTSEQPLAEPTNNPVAAKTEPVSGRPTPVTYSLAVRGRKQRKERLPAEVVRLKDSPIIEH